MSFLFDFFNKDKYYKETYEKADYDETYKVPTFLMKLIGIKITRKLSTCMSICWDVFFWFEFGNLCLGMSAEFVSMVEMGKGGTFEDMTDVFKTMPCLGFTAVALTKSYKMVRYREVFEKIIDETREIWHVGSIDDEERNLTGSTLRYINFIVKAFHFCNKLLLVLFSSPPFWEMFKRCIGRENKKDLHFTYWLPFDPYQPVYYEVMLVTQTWHTLATVWANLCGDLLFLIFLSHISLQFDLLSLRIKKLIPVPTDHQLLATYPLGVESVKWVDDTLAVEQLAAKDLEQHYDKELEKIIIRHRALIKLSDDVEKVFSFPLLVNFINSSIVICFCGFCSVVVEKWNETKYKSFLVTAVSQIWIMCWYGQKLINSSAGVSQAVYNCGWYEVPKKMRSTLLIILQRSQKPKCVTTYGFSIVSLNSYCTIIKTAWSYFTLLLNTYKQ